MSSKTNKVIKSDSKDVLDRIILSEYFMYEQIVERSQKASNLNDLIPFLKMLYGVDYLKEILKMRIEEVFRNKQRSVPEQNCSIIGLYFNVMSLEDVLPSHILAYIITFLHSCHYAYLPILSKRIHRVMTTDISVFKHYTLMVDHNECFVKLSVSFDIQTSMDPFRVSCGTLHTFFFFFFFERRKKKIGQKLSESKYFSFETREELQGWGSSDGNDLQIGFDFSNGTVNANSNFTIPDINGIKGFFFFLLFFFSIDLLVIVRILLYFCSTEAQNSDINTDAQSFQLETGEISQFSFEFDQPPEPSKRCMFFFLEEKGKRVSFEVVQICFVMFQRKKKKKSNIWSVDKTEDPPQVTSDWSKNLNIGDAFDFVVPSPNPKKESGEKYFVCTLSLCLIYRIEQKERGLTQDVESNDSVVKIVKALTLACSFFRSLQFLQCIPLNYQLLNYPKFANVIHVRMEGQLQQDPSVFFNTTLKSTGGEPKDTVYSIIRNILDVCAANNVPLKGLRLKGQKHSLSGSMLPFSHISGHVPTYITIKIPKTVHWLSINGINDDICIDLSECNLIVGFRIRSTLFKVIKWPKNENARIWCINIGMRQSDMTFYDSLKLINYKYQKNGLVQIVSFHLRHFIDMTVRKMWLGKVGADHAQIEDIVLAFSKTDLDRIPNDFIFKLLMKWAFGNDENVYNSKMQAFADWFDLKLAPWIQYFALFPNRASSKLYFK
ncbi:hypothetical protein RFI_14375 [Reticulomyxa filosa]|uniref:Uncharacterized protein n=1 Tax=Reticulomyxa filosa TaxID=46433 RepID=X6N9X0_RETFI|nr:hypothetical protein RFI_14375 [Reticulomyxa filosa]|eukprot:ETO22821.1 hypothetical protein RFI_14375 [Reticulomyxa filosa]